MLAPFVTDLLIVCSFLLLAGWANEMMARWLGPVGRAGSSAAFRSLDRRREINDDGLRVCGSYGLFGDWQFKVDHRERNG
jgi:hypothetical protein